MLRILLSVVFLIPVLSGFGQQYDDHTYARQQKERNVTLLSPKGASKVTIGKVVVSVFSTRVDTNENVSYYPPYNGLSGCWIAYYTNSMKLYCKACYGSNKRMKSVTYYDAFGRLYLVNEFSSSAKIIKAVSYHSNGRVRGIVLFNVDGSIKDAKWWDELGKSKSADLDTLYKIKR